MAEFRRGRAAAAILAAALARGPAMAAQPEDLSFQSADGVSLAASFYPASPGPARAAAVLLPMLGRGRGDWEAFAREASRRGIACLALDPRGHGGSGNPAGKPAALWGPSEWEGVLGDAAAAWGRLRRMGFPPERIFLVGASIGGSLALRYAAAHPEVRGVALLSPGDNPRRVPIMEAAGGYGSRPILIASSLDDERFHEIASRLARSLPGPKTLLVFRKAGHGTDMFGREDRPGRLTRALIDWMIRAAKSGEPAPRRPVPMRG